MHNAQLLHWDHVHQLCKTHARDSVVVDVELGDPSVLDDLDKLFSTNIFDIIVLQLQLLDGWTFLN